MNKKTLLLNSIFFIGLSLSIVFIKQFMDLSSTESKINDIKSPDAYMINASYLRTNETGQREVVLFSPFVTHYKYQDSSEFISPKILVFRNQDRWQISANKAKGLNGANTFYLLNGVKVHQLASKNNPGTVLTTKTLTVFPKKNLVTTEDFVTIEQPGMTMNAVGLRGDLNSGNFKLLSKTRSQYEPKKNEKNYHP